MDNEFFLWITEGAKELSVDLSDSQKEQFYLYYQMLTEWNQVMNLTAITEKKQVVFKHFVDSISLIKAVPQIYGRQNSLSPETQKDRTEPIQKKEIRIIDVGTGAGFPGIPLKITFPELQITLLDSLNKRIRFLDAVIDELRLTGITAVHGRAEDFGRDPDYREKYDLCVSRAVSNLSTLSEYCLPFVRVGGVFVSYKSGSVDQELKQSEKSVRLLGGRTESTTDFDLPGSDMGSRSLILIKKIEKTSLKYPRKPGTPAKEPLH